MKKILFLLLFPLFGLAQITPLNYWQITGNSPSTNTTYIGTKNSRSLILKTNSTQRVKIDSIGNVKINGTVTVIGPTTFSGSTTYTGSVTTPTLYGSSSPSGTLNIFSTSSATPGVINIGASTGTTNLNSAVLTASNAVASFSTINVTGASTLTGIINTNTINCSSNLTFSASTGHLFNVNGGNRGYWTSSGLRVGSSASPSATLDVTGTMSVSGTSTLTGAVQTSTINNNSGTLYLGSFGGNVLNVSGGTIAFSPSGNSTTGSSVPFSFNAPAHFSITASTNVPSFKFTGTTKGFMAGAKSLQYENWLTASTYTATGATTITTASGLHVEKPIMSTNVTATNVWGITTDGGISATGNLAATGSLYLGSGPSVLSAGNTGTIAVLSDAVFAVHLFAASISPADATTYYFGNSGGIGTSSATSTINIPYNCTLVGYDFSAYVNTTAGSAETATISIAGTTNYTLTSSFTYSAASGNNTSSGTGLSQNFNANDKINIKITCPTWATNPTSVVHGVTLWFVRRP